MEVRRATECLFRSQSRLRALINPVRATSRWTTRQASSAHRHFNTTALRRQEETPKPSKQKGKAVDEGTGLLNEALDFNKGVSTTSAQRTSRFPSPAAQQENRITSASPSEKTQSQRPSDKPPAKDTRSSYADLLESFNLPSQRNTRRGPETTTPSFPSSFGVYGPKSGISSILDFQRKPVIDPYNLPKPKPLDVKLGPSLGRTFIIDANKNMDIGQAFRRLDIQLARNKVRSDMMRQRFHERPGALRKRLHSTRWRAKFKDEFKGMVQLVMKMKKQGW